MKRQPAKPTGDVLNLKNDIIRRAKVQLGRQAGARWAPMALRLRAETRVTLEWITKPLRLGTWTHVANWLCRCNTETNNSTEITGCHRPSCPVGVVS